MQIRLFRYIRPRSKSGLGESIFRRLGNASGKLFNSTSVKLLEILNLLCLRYYQELFSQIICGI